MLAAKGPRLSSQLPKIRSIRQAESRPADVLNKHGLFTVGARLTHAQAKPSESFGFKPDNCVQRESKESGVLHEHVTIGTALEKIVSRSRRCGPPLYMLTAAESEESPTWKFVFEQKVAIEPKPDTSFGEWLNYVEMVTTKAEDSIPVVPKIIQMLNANHDAQLDWIDIKLSVASVVKVLTNLKSPMSAFLFYKWFRERSYYAPDKSVYTALIEQLITSTNLDTWDQVHAIVSDMIDSKTAMDNNQFGRVLALIEATKPIDTSRVQLYVEWLLQMRPLGLEPWSSTYEKVMKICNKLEMYYSTISIFKSIPANSYYWAFSLAFTACKCTSNVAFAEELLREMKLQNMGLDVKCCNDLLTMHASLGHADKAKDLLEEMKNSGVSMDLRPYISVMHAYAKAGRVKEAEDLFRSLEQKLDPGIYRAMAACYRATGHFEELLIVLRQQDGSQIGATCFAAAFEECVEKSEWNVALTILKDMQEWGMSPAPRLYHSIVLACSKVNDYSACKVVEFNLREMDVLSLEELERIIKMYVALEKVPSVLDALEVLNERELGPPTPDIFEHCILSFAKTNLANAMKMYEVMRSAGHVPSSSLLTKLIQEHVNAENMVKGKGLHGARQEATFQLENLVASLMLPSCKI